jgi:hypothetical protein
LITHGICTLCLKTLQFVCSCICKVIDVSSTDSQWRVQDL